MQSLAQNQQREQIRRRLRVAIGLHHHRQSEQVGPRENVLRESDVLSLVREPVQEPVDVHMCGGIHERSRVAVEFEVVPLPADELRDLLHVGFPVYLGV